MNPVPKGVFRKIYPTCMAQPDSDIAEWPTLLTGGKKASIDKKVQFIKIWGKNVIPSDTPKRY